MSWVEYILADCLIEFVLGERGIIFECWITLACLALSNIPIYFHILICLAKSCLLQRKESFFLEWKFEFSVLLNCNGLWKVIILVVLHETSNRSPKMYILMLFIITKFHQLIFLFILLTHSYIVVYKCMCVYVHVYTQMYLFLKNPHFWKLVFKGSFHFFYFYKSSYL